jgi:hypothetical protein
MLEPLETRVVPTVFIWTDQTTIPIQKGQWEVAANWQSIGGAAGAYPGWDGSAATTNDLARFLPLVNDQCTMGSAHELASIEVYNPNINVILGRQLTLNNGGILAAGRILQGVNPGANGPIVITGGTFDWTGGDINYSPTIATSASSFHIESGVVNFAPVGPGGLSSSFGDDLVIDQLGDLHLDNASGNGINGIVLRNRPTITNAGTISIEVDNAFGWTVAQGDPVNTIQNTGTIQRTLGNGSYSFANPVNNNNGNILVQHGRLRFAGADPTTGFSVMNQGTGTVTLNGGTALRVPFGLDQTGGTISAPDAAHATITGRVKVDGGTVSVGSTQGELDIGGVFTFTGGTVQISSQLNVERQNALILADNNIAITKATTTVAVTFVGAGNQSGTINVMRSRTGTINDICQTNPANYNPVRTQIIRANDTYRLVRQGAGMGQAPGVMGINPNSGPTTGNTLVTISGTNFTPDSIVFFGLEQSSTVTYVSSTELTAVSPMEAIGTVDVIVNTEGGSSSTSVSDQFTYVNPAAPTVTGVSPSSGSFSGGNTVTITGTNFDPRPRSTLAPNRRTA